MSKCFFSFFTVLMPHRLIQLTDCHLFTDVTTTSAGFNTYQMLRTILGQIKPKSCDALLFTGDLAQDERPETYQHYLDLTQNWACPIYWLPGNHDDPDAMQTLLCRPPWQLQKHIDLGNWRIILLNSHWPGHVDGRLPAAELTRLDHLLQSHPGPVLIFLHHHLTYTEMGLDNTRAFLNTLKPYRDKLQAIVSGHVHAEFELDFDGFHFLTTPSTCYQFKMEKDKAVLDDQPPGYREFTLHADGQWQSRVVRSIS